MLNSDLEAKILALTGSALGNITWAFMGVGGGLWKICKGIAVRYAKKGMYEVLDYQTILTIHDDKGKNASLAKIEKVRFLQDNVIAYQDQAWGDGKILLNYQCSPGVPVDFYRTGYRTHILISLRDLKNKRAVTEFNIRWDMKNCFLKPTGYWSTDINHSTGHIKV
jgi:hypothetical protein